VKAGRAWTAALLAAALSVSVVGCGGDSDPASTSESVTSESIDRGSGSESSGESTSSGNSFADSGGGSSQFRGSGDNSVQNFGAEASDSARKKAALTLWGYLDARADASWGKACSYLSAATQRTLQNSALARGRACPQILGAYLGELSPANKAQWTTADVGSLRVDGSKGFLLYHGGGKTNYFMQMVEEGGTWKAAGVAPVPLS
jgi:hypothetical protein